MLRRLLLRAGLFLFAAPVFAGVNQWTLLGPYGPEAALPVQALAISAEAIYVGSDSEVFRSTDGGLHWTAVFHAPSGPVLSLAARPSSPRVVYAGTADGVFRSIDEGDTWFAAGLVGEQVSVLAVDPGDSSTLYAGTFNVTDVRGIFKSADSGVTWSRVFTLPSAFVTVLAIDPNDPETVLAGGYGVGGVLRTRDGGAHWELLSGGNYCRAIAFDPADSSRVYAIWTSGVCPGFCPPDTMQRSEDGGETWSDVTTLPGSYIGAVVVDPSSKVYAVGGDRVYASGDHGKTWSPIDVQTSFFPSALALDPLEPAQLYAATFEGLYGILVDPGGPCATPGTMLCLQDGRFQVTLGWQLSPLGPTFPAPAVPVSADSGYFWFFDPDNVEVMVKVLDGTSINGHFWVFYGALSNVQYTVQVTDTRTGATKTYENPAGTLASVADTSAFPAAVAGSSKVPAMGPKATPVGRSTLASWSPIGPDPERGVYAIAVDPRYPHIYAAVGGDTYTVFKTNDGGATWAPLVTFPEFVGELHLDLYSPDIVYAVTASSLYRSSDAGGTWQAIANGLGACCLAFDSLAAGTLYAGSPTAFLVSTDHGSTWTPRGPELAGKAVGPIATTSSGKFYAVADGKNFWTSDDSGLSWNLVHEFPNGGLQPLIAHRWIHSTVYVSESCCGGVGVPTVPPALPVWKSEDGGSTWREIFRTEGGANAIALDPSDSAVLYAGGYAGVFRSANGGTSWTAINEGLSGRVFSLELDQGSTLFAGTTSGAFKLDLEGFPGSCVTNGLALCLNAGRFQVEAAFQLSPSGPVIQARAVPLTGDTGYFWFFDEANVELVVKVLDGRPINGHFWVFYGALSSVEYTITVTDTQTGDVRTYHNDRGNLASVADTSAF